MRRGLFFLVIMLFIAQVSAQSLLFVGNSLSYSNDLPGMVQAIGKSLGRKIETDCLCKPNYALEDHWREKDLKRRMNAYSYDFVLFQQGPSSQPNGRESLQEYGGKIAKLARNKGARPAFFMVWPSTGYYHTMNAVIKNYRDAANKNQTLLLPAGFIWKQYRKQKDLISLYQFDQFHPSSTGSFLAAVTIYHGLFPEDNLRQLKPGKFKKWVMDRDSFDTIIDLVLIGGPVE